ncbi:MAG: hypothetical protein KKC99_13190 [Proteobacteria bacterium]|nr:hypothetical protein [Pseudomonadota bacterium]
MTPLGEFFENLRGNWKTLRLVFYVVLAITVGLNFFIYPHVPHFGLDAYPGFFAGFGLIFGLAMVIIMKRIIQPMIGRGEDYYDSDD